MSLPVVPLRCGAARTASLSELRPSPTGDAFLNALPDSLAQQPRRTAGHRCVNAGLAALRLPESPAVQCRAVSFPVGTGHEPILAPDCP